MLDSQKLLADYVKNGSEAAFSELVTRYVDLVHSTALRLVSGDTFLAEDVAQTVFMNLARKGRFLPREVMIGGWLHRHTCFVASKMLRGEHRRRLRERHAAEMNMLQDHTEANLAQLTPVLDQAIEQLGAEERAAILLRFFEQLDFRSVGERLGSSEEAARKRVSRALGKLRTLLAHRGVTLSAVSLATLLAAKAVTAAPTGLAAAITGAALTSGAAATGATFGLLHLMTITKTKLAIVGLTVTCLVIPLALQHRSLLRLREEHNSLRQQLDASARTQARAEPPPGSMEQTTPVLAHGQANELLRLRGQIGLLRRQANELQQENQQLRSELISQPPGFTNGFASHRFVPLSQVAFAGYSTPEAALESLLWAERETNVNAYLNALTPEQQQSEQARLRASFEQGDSQLFFREGQLVTGFQVLETTAESDDTVSVRFVAGGQGGTIKLVAKRIGQEWKMCSGITF